MNRKIAVTKAMTEAGADTLQQCRAVGHDDRATAHMVFTAMAAESAWMSPVRQRPIPKHVVKYTFDGKRLPRNPFKLSDFDAEGKRYAGTLDDGRAVYQYKHNFWYLAPKYTKV